MSSVYAKRFEAVFLCTHPKGPLMFYTAAAKYIKKWKSFVKKWVERYKVNKTVDDLPERGKCLGLLFTALFWVFRALHRELECSENAPNI